MIAFAMCGSYCTHKTALGALERLCADGRDITAVLSENVWTTDTRFGTSAALRENLRSITGHEVLHSILETEPFGPDERWKMLIICPCTGNTLAKIASGITDTSVTMAAKAMMRRSAPIVIALSSNDAVGTNLANLAALYQKKNVYFVPLRQDDPVKKPFSLSADFSRLSETVLAAENGEQPRPLFL